MNVHENLADYNADAPDFDRSNRRLGKVGGYGRLSQNKRLRESNMNFITICTRLWLTNEKGGNKFKFKVPSDRSETGEDLLSQLSGN